MAISRKTICAALLAATAAHTGMVILPASAQVSPQTFELPSQELARTLRAIARQSGREILFADSDVRGRRAPAVRGSFTVDQAVRLAISGSGLVVDEEAGALVVRASSHAGRRIRPRRISP